MGNMTVPLSMVLIGVSLGRADLKQVFTDRENYVFSAVSMLLIPLAAILLCRLLPFDNIVRTVFCLAVSMPVANFAGMLAQEYGGSGDSCHRMILFTTALSVVTIPLLSVLFPG